VNLFLLSAFQGCASAWLKPGRPKRHSAAPTTGFQPSLFFNSEIFIMGSESTPVAQQAQAAEAAKVAAQRAETQQSQQAATAAGQAAVHAVMMRRG
jgi:hypothetical protein